MKIHFEPKDFLKRFKIAASVCPKADIKPILCNVKVVADKRHGVFLYATDTEHGIRIQVNSDISEYGTAILSVKQFRQILESEKPQDWYSVTLSTVDENVIAIESESTDTRLNTHSPEEFPDVVDFTAESYHMIDVDDLQTAIKRTVFAIEKGNEKYVLAGVCFESETDIAHRSHDTIYAIGMDGRRMAVQRMGYTTPVGSHTFVSYVNKKPEHQTIIPVKALNLLTKTLKEKSIKRDNTVKMAVIRGQHPSFKNGEHVAMFHCGDVTIFSRLLEGRFPNWRNIIPTMESAKSLRGQVKSGELLKAIKSVDAVSTSLEPGIFLTFEPGKLTLEGRGKETGITKTSIAADCNGKGFVKLDPVCLTSMLSTLGKDTVATFAINGHDPVCLTAGDAYQYVIMPMIGEKNEVTHQVDVVEETEDRRQQTAEDEAEEIPELTDEDDEEPMSETENESELIPEDEDVTFREDSTIEEDDTEPETSQHEGTRSAVKIRFYKKDVLPKLKIAASLAQDRYEY